jgi:S1-C subfamily serine protease
MAIRPASALSQLSDAIASQVALAAPMLAAIRVGPNRHISGILWQQNLLITSDQALPAQDSYTLVLPGGVLTAAWPARRSATGSVASLRFEGTADPVPIPLPLEPRVGALTLVLGADADAAPTARLALIHHVSANGTDPALTLDMPTDLVAEGGPVLDAAGGLLGMAIIGAGGEATVIPYASIARLLDPIHAQISGKRGWLGVALQPITVPETMRGAVGQSSGRMVVSLAPKGPAELAGLRPGDILLSVDGHSISGTHTLRAFLGPEQVGRQVDVRLLRDGQMETRHLTIAPQPAG